jgi:hypothetical protein
MTRYRREIARETSQSKYASFLEAKETSMLLTDLAVGGGLKTGAAVAV